MDDIDYESPPSPASFNGSETRSGKPKRLNHNELERKRRHHQKERLTELKDAIPTLQTDKPSTVLIMQKAKEYIDVLKKRCVEMENEMDRMRQALLQLTAQNQNQRAIIQKPTGYRGQDATETDSLRRENFELKNQLMLLDKKFTSLGKPLEAHHAKSNSMNNIRIDNFNGMNMWPIPGPIPNKSQTDQNPHDSHLHAHIPRNPATTSLPSQPPTHLSQPRANHNSPTPTGDRLVGGMNPPPSSMVLGPNGLAPNEMNVAPADSSSGHLPSKSSSIDMSSHLRKRKSLVDHEYNDMQQGFYDRRDSTIQALQAMRETQSYTMHPSESARQVNASESPILRHSTRAANADKRNVLPSLILPMLSSDASAMHTMGDEPYVGEEVKCRVCNGGLAGLIMLDCDRCHNWYHGQCVGVDSKKIPSSWICNPCLGV